MDIKYWRVLTVFGWVLFVAALIFVILFGLKISNWNDTKAQEISDAISQKQSEMEVLCRENNEKDTTTYIADEYFGSFEFSYPKVWQTNVTQYLAINEQLVFMADPSIVLIDKDAKGPYPALKVIVYNTKYESKLKELESKNKYAKSRQAEEDASVSGLSGKKFSGKDVDSGKQIIYVILPLRDKTLYIGTTDSSLYADHYNTILNSFEISK